MRVQAKVKSGLKDVSLAAVRDFDAKRANTWDPNLVWGLLFGIQVLSRMVCCFGFAGLLSGVCCIG